MNINKTGSQARIQTAPTPSSVALESIWAKMFFVDFTGSQVPDLHTPDMLHMLYLRLFKHMMDWIQAFLKKHGRLQAFDNFGRHYRRTLDFWYPKKPTARLRKAREEDEVSEALYFGSSRGGTAPATGFTCDTFQTCSRMRQGARRLQYDGAIPKPHV